MLLRVTPYYNTMGKWRCFTKRVWNRLCSPKQSSCFVMVACNKKFWYRNYRISHASDTIEGGRSRFRNLWCYQNVICGNISTSWIYISRSRLEKCSSYECTNWIWCWETDDYQPVIYLIGYSGIGVTFKEDCFIPTFTYRFSRC